MTCNSKWPEILRELLPSRTAPDRPDLVARVFCAKLEDMKDHIFKKHILCKFGAYVYVIEFQKRGLPHAHFLLIMTPEHKMTNLDHYDKNVCAEIPDPNRYPQMHELVVQHMMHGPCGHLRPSSPCMQSKPKKCRFRYPKQFNDKTMQAEDSYSLYQQRNSGINMNVRGNILDNRWVVLYNSKLLMMFNYHINVEACSSITSVKYVFKYVYKGHDKQVVQIDSEEERVVINEIRRFQDACYVSPPEAIWRIFSFILSQMHPYMMVLQLHLPNKQMSMGKSLNDLDLPMVDANANFQSGEFCEVQEECSIVVEDEHLRPLDSLNSNQKYAYDEIMRHIDEDCPGVFFIDGPRGTVNIFL
ncbi:uncharacterized protein LOC112504284 [Cynara cardunculus var. scolymus]|uniref:uncharacterized protein LOC112504284 n=1 Tax=Cynara cardunculus var. scolymus TaxID=59895 RepID=UPI000D629184|nr:uncharacterized protein LOC112504284 [Cynara cardunculus var. scolymus]